MSKRIESVVSYERRGSSIVFICRLDNGEDAFVRIDMLATDMVRVRASLNNVFPLTLPEKDGFLKYEWPQQTLTVKETNGTVETRTGRMKVEIAKKPFSLSFCDEQGNLFLKEHAEGGMLWKGDRVSETMESPQDELFYGFADQGRGWPGPISSTRDRAPLNHRGSQIRLENLTNMWSHGLPFFLSSKGYGLYLNTTSASTFDMALTSQNQYTFKVDIPELDYYVICGPSFKDILARYTELTGRSPLIPKWSMAPMVYGVNPNEAYLRATGMGGGGGGPNPRDGRGPKTWYFQKQIEDQAKEIRTKRQPCGSLVLDAWAWTGLTSFVWNPEIPEPEKMIETINRSHLRFMPWQRPTLVAYAHSDGSYAGQRMYGGEAYEEAERNGYFIKKPDGKTLLCDNAGYGPSSLVDFTNPEAVKWWKSLQRRITKMGAEEWWLDSASSGYIEFFPEAMDARFHNGMTGRELNCYNTPLYYKAVFEGLKEDLKGKRALVDCRCVTPIAPQRYPLQSYGDRTHRTTVATHVRCAINYGLTGIPFWYAAAIGLFGPPLPAEMQMRFNPYTYAYWREANQKGIPIVRAMIFEYQDDPNTRLIDDQYMFGQELLIAPILEKDVPDRPVYFPKGVWVNYWNGERYEGPRTVSCPALGPEVETIACDVNKIKVPIFVKAGSIIPMAPPMEWADQRPWDPLTLEIYMPDGGGNAGFVLYEDDGETYAYEEGEYAETMFTAEEKDGQVMVRIGPTKGDYKGRLDRRTYIVKLNNTNRPAAVRMNDETLKQYKTLEELESSPGGWFYDTRGTRAIWCKTTSISSTAEAILTFEDTRTVGFYRS